MAKRLVTLFSRMDTWLLCLYPAEWRQEFGEEMHLVFTEAVTLPAQRGGLCLFFWRELRDTPQSVAKVYWYGCTRKWRRGAQRLHETTSAADLPPPPPDGRDSWRQAVLELSLFLLTTLLLLLATYRQLIAFSPGWQRNMGFLGQIIVPLTLFIQARAGHYPETLAALRPRDGQGFGDASSFSVALGDVNGDGWTGAIRLRRQDG